MGYNGEDVSQSRTRLLLKEVDLAPISMSCNIRIIWNLEKRSTSVIRALEVVFLQNITAIAFVTRCPLNS